MIRLLSRYYGSDNIEHYETIKSQYQYKLQKDRLSEQLASANQGFVRFVAEVLDSKDTFLPAENYRSSFDLARSADEASQYKTGLAAR